MNKLDASPLTLTVPSASLPHLQPAHRLIVLVPESETNTIIAARKVWELANALECRVQFIGLSSDAALEPALRRQLVNLCAMVEDENIPVDSKIETGNNWLSVVKSYWQKGDVVICFAEQRSTLAHRSLSQILESNLDIPVYVITGMYQEEVSLWSKWKIDAIGWAGSIGIILGFLWLQIKLTQVPTDSTHTFLLYLSLFTEAGAIWIWNSLFK